MAFVDYFKIIRPMNAFMVTVMAVSGIWFANEFDAIWFYYPLTAVVVISYIGIAMVHNDIIDLEIDRINAPNRPIPSGNLSLKQAKKYIIFLFVIGTTAGLFLKYEAIIIMVSTLVISLLYNSKLKKTGFLGNLSVGFTATSAFLYGDAVASGFSNFWPFNSWNASVYLFLISALLNTSREVAKGIMDVSGDELHNVRTIAVRYGKKFAAKFVWILLILAMIFAILPIINDIFGWVFIAALITFLILIIQVGVPLVKNPSYETANKFKKRIILIMLFALIIIIIDVQV